MEKLNYSTLNTKTNNEVNKFVFNEKEIEVLKYLSVSEKFDIIDITIQKAKVNKKFISLLLDVAFSLNLVYMYSNIEFSAEDREDEFKLYDELVSSGFMEEFLNHIEDSEYEFLLEMLEEQVKTDKEMDMSTAGIVNSLITDLPAAAQAAADLVDSFDKEKFQEVTNFAKAIREIDNPKIVSLPSQE